MAQGRRCQSLVHPSWVSAFRRDGKHCLLDVPKESLHAIGQAGRVDESYLYGTNFRHTVEFSRSGRTPFRPSQAVQGQPEPRYPVDSAKVKPLRFARLPAWSPHTARDIPVRGASRLGDVRPVPLAAPRSPGDLAAAPCVEQEEH
jgi:hypothetical protein